ncbi:MAG TPA: anti-sigma factor [Edaphobacter sp.]|nr:anti-sigma factor [Edaphobacter sp.]
MAEFNQFNQFGNKQPSRSPDPAHCAQCEAMLTDALDRTLSAEDQTIFDRHLAICPDCSRMFIDARLGADLMSKLHDSRPEPTSALLERILATTGPEAEKYAASTARQNTLLSYPAPAAAAAIPAAYTASNVLPFKKRLANAFRPSALAHTLMQPRLAMTAAMAFFSIALTLNLTGVHITQLRASDFTPSSIKRTFYDTNARVVRSIDNLRVVYELESRVRDLQRDSDGGDATVPAQNSPAPSQSNSPSDQNKNDRNQAPEQQNQEKRSNPHPRSGSSRSLGLERSRKFTASLAQPGSSPEPGHEAPQVFDIFTPKIYNSIEQGGQA